MTPADPATVAAVARWLEDAAPVRGLKPHHRAWLAEALRCGAWTAHTDRPARYREAVAEARFWVAREFGRTLTDSEARAIIAARRASAQRTADREERERRALDRELAALRRAMSEGSPWP